MADRTHDDIAGSGDPPAERRASGIRLLGELPWGSHVCIFYETRQDLLDANVDYFTAGLAANERCLWALSAPVDEAAARAALAAAIPDIEMHIASGRMELIDGAEWYLPGGEFDMQRITGGWHDKTRQAIEDGFEGLRVSGNAFWIGTCHWKLFTEYENELDRSLAGCRMLVMCTYSLAQSRSVDLLDVARAHQFTLARRSGRWEFLETPELQRAKQEIRQLTGALDALTNPFAERESLTSRERVVLAQILRGSSGKEIARTLTITPRTVEFHRANLLRKFGARTTIDLVRLVLEAS